MALYSKTLNHNPLFELFKGKEGHFNYSWRIKPWRIKDYQTWEGLPSPLNYSQRC